MAPSTLVCRYCGKPLKNSSRAYCDNTCYQQSRKDKTKAILSALPACENCGNPVALGNTRFCSSKCQKEFTQKHLPKCKHCGKPVRRPTNIYCSPACVTAAKRNYRTCIICGNRFPAAPSDKTVTCSAECSSRNRKENFEIESAQRALPNFPHTRAGTAHHSAKYWVIQSPTGEIYEINSLLHWAKTNQDLFPQSTITQFYNGIKSIKRYQKGKSKRKFSQFKGWLLLDWADD